MRPLLIVGDAPNLQNGLGRIARDVARLLHSRADELGVKVSQLGWGYDGSPWPWRTYPIMDHRNWGEGDILQTLLWAGEEVGETARPIVLTVWDPSRCFPIVKVLEKLPAQRPELWGYFPIDSHNRGGAIGGPAEEALRAYDRVLGYGRFGARVLAKTLDPKRDVDVPRLPHGLHAEMTPWSGPVRHEGQVAAFLNSQRPGDLLVGVVAANQPRKDFGLAFEVAARVRDAWEKRGPRVSARMWVCTDRAVNENNDLAWALPELARQYGWNNPRLGVVTRLRDEQLADLYRRSGVTLAPGLGEGFGYPIAESLACGTPVIHGAFGGGEEWISEKRWVVQPVATRTEGPYVLVRPVYDAEAWAARALEAAEWKVREPRACMAYCSGSVEHLRWENLGAAWLRLVGQWIKEG